MHTEQPGWGIIGTGMIAALQTADLRTAGCRVAAVGSRSRASADTFADRFDIANRHGSYADLVADPAVEIVYVATPHPMHAESALLAIEAGKHVLVEKAFTLNAGEAAEVAAAAERAGVVVMEAMWTRFLPMMTRIFELIGAGAIGTPRVLLAEHNQYIPYERAARLHEPSLGGGALLDLGIYPISLAFRLFGDPAGILARGTLTERGVDEHVGMVFTFDGGAIATMQCGMLTPGPNRASIVGDSGRIDIDSVWYSQTTFSRYDRDERLVERYDATIDGRGMQFQALELERCVREGVASSPVMPITETVAIMRAMDEIRRQIGVVYPKEQ